jgi:cytochrome c oxidase subunit IV
VQVPTFVSSSSPSSANKLRFFGILGILPRYTLSNAVKLLSASLIMTVFRSMCFDRSMVVQYENMFVLFSHFCNFRIFDNSCSLYLSLVVMTSNKVETTRVIAVETWNP